MDVRPLTREDAAELAPLVAALAEHHGAIATATEATLERDLADGWFWGFGTEPGLQGYVLLFAHAQADLGLRGAVIHHVYVVPHARRRGLARALIAAAEDDARSRGCDYVQIAAHAGNDAARDTYVALGYDFAAPTFWRFRKAL